MTDQSLREALEALRADLDRSYPRRAQYDIPSTVIDRVDAMLGAHPAEPAPVGVEITEEAVKAGANTYWETEGNRAVCMRAALEAALPHLPPRPSRTAEAVGYNIVNQLADLWEVPVDVRQATNDRCWTFAAKLVATAMNGKSDG